MIKSEAGEEGRVAIAFNGIIVSLLFSNNEFQSGYEPTELVCSRLVFKSV